jgi:predicted MFS family arabinose efflux permease
MPPAARSFEDRRTFLTASAADFALHMLLGAVSYRARELGASQGEMGLVGAAGDFVYMASCLLLGGVSERFGRRRAVRVCTVVFVGAGLAAWAAESLTGLVVAVVAQRIAAAVFWPTIQGRLADQSSDLGRDAGLFNLSWSVGKSCGYLVNFALFSHLGLPTTAAFLVSGGASLLIGLAMPADRRFKAVREDGARIPPEESAAASRMIGVALLGNFAGCAAFTVVMNQSSALMAERGLGSGDGSFLTACFVAAQIATFAFVARRHAVVGRPATLLTASALVATGLGLFAASRSTGALAAAAFVTGTGAGLAYAQAMLLSLRLPAAATKGAGRHEAVIGAANATVAPLAGYAATATGRPDDALLAAGAAVVVAGVLQAAKLAADRRRR